MNGVNRSAPLESSFLGSYARCVWVLYIVGGLVVAVLWLIVGTQGLCPSCGIELADSYGYPGSKVNWCPCGWRDT